jgi:hypothetical protein
MPSLKLLLRKFISSDIKRLKEYENLRPTTIVYIILHAVARSVEFARGLKPRS